MGKRNWKEIRRTEGDYHENGRVKLENMRIGLNQ